MSNEKNGRESIRPKTQRFQNEEKCVLGKKRKEEKKFETGLIRSLMGS